MHKELNELKTLINRNYGVIGGRTLIMKKLDSIIKKVEPKPKKESTETISPK
jgi:hypothetical protein